MQKIQEELGYLPPDAMLEVARFLNIPEIDVYSVATFYNQFRLTPPGKHSIRVCMGTACHVKGGHITLAAWQRRLKIGPGETTPDREFDLDTVACVGCCAMAPVTVVDKKVEAKADPTRVDGILLNYQLQKEKEEKGKELKFEEIKKQAESHWREIWNDQMPVILVGTATCGRAAGALEVLQAIKETVKKQNLDCLIYEVGCMGHCYAEPLVITSQARISFHLLWPCHSSIGREFGD